MRQVGQLSSERDARRFAAFLITQDIDAHAEQDGAGWLVWVRDEDKLSPARKELELFLAEPGSPRYSDAERKAEAARREADQKREQARKNTVQMRDRWGSSAGAAKRSPVALLTIGACILVALLTSAGNDRNSRVLAGLRFSDPDASSPQLVAEFNRSIREGGTREDFERQRHSDLIWASIRRGEIWRLFTPMLLHFGYMHLLFNMYWLYTIGGQVENRYGSWRMLLFILVVAGLSNAGQAMAVNYNFGGMSGVNYGLFGFAWMRSKYDPTSRLFLDPVTVFMMLLWFGICLATDVPALQPVLGPAMGRVANVAHAVGLLVGVAAGYPWRPLASKP